MVNNCIFLGNKATYGGGSYGGYLHKKLPWLQTPLNCTHNFSSNHYENNTAEFGGGTSIFSTRTNNTEPHTKCQVFFENCMWTHNRAQYGSAVTILPNAWNLYNNGYLPDIHLTDCTFETNFVTHKEVYKNGSFTQYSKGAGAVYSSSHILVFKNNTTFCNNNGTALDVSFSIVHFERYSEVSFTNNNGYEGGAIFQLSSVIYLYESSTLLFENNTAYDKGGAIYQHTAVMHIFDYSHTCFLDYISLKEDPSKRNISVMFINNRAGVGTHSSSSKYGHSIYASSLLPCYTRFRVPASNLSDETIFDQIGDFTFEPSAMNGSMQISTNANHSEILSNELLDFIPGKETTLPFIDRDDMNQTVKTDYLVTIASEDANNSEVEISPLYFEIVNKTLVLHGETSAMATVTLSTTYSRQIALTFNARMRPCPPGLIQQVDKDGKPGPCICSAHTDSSYRGIVECNLTLMQAFRKQSFWVGYNNTETESEHSLITGQCPLGFCSNITLMPPTANRTSLEETICTESRTGILCGKCKANHSVHYHSINFKCESDKLCKWGLVFYILSEILPVTIIFLVIIIFNISFTSGRLNGFIFYCQIVGIFHTKAALSFQNSSSIKAVSRILLFFYMFFNLNPFVLDELSFCLWKNTNVLDVLVFSYITLAYALILTISVIAVMNKCSMIWNKFLRKIHSYKLIEPKQNTLQHSIIHGLSAFLILCYAQCALVSILILSGERITSQQSQRLVVLYDGGMIWLSIQHLRYAIPAFVFGLVIVFTPPILLLVYPIHYKIFTALHIRETQLVKVVFNPLERLKPFLDSFQGCFKDNYRFFSGLYFVYRFLIIAIEGGSPLLGEILLVLMLILHAVCQPHKERLHNIIDTLLFGNLVIINAITMYNDFQHTKPSSVKISKPYLTWIQLILISLPLLVKITCIIATFFFPKCKALFRKLKGVRDLSESERLEFPGRILYGSNEEA